MWRGKFVKENVVNYKGHGRFPFPPTDTDVLVERVLIQRDGDDGARERLLRIARRFAQTRGRISIEIADPAGEVQRWSGTIVDKQPGGQLLVLYDRWRKKPLRFPPPAKAHLDIKKVRFYGHPVIAGPAQQGERSPREPEGETATPPKAQKKHQIGLETRYCTWNVRTLKGAWRHRELEAWLSEKGCQICALQETHLKDDDTIDMKKYKFIGRPGDSYFHEIEAPIGAT